MEIENQEGDSCKIIHPCLPLPYYLQCSLNSYIIIFDICSGSGLYLSADHPLARSRLGGLLHPALAVQSAAHHIAATKIFGMLQKNIKTIPAGALLEFHPLSVFILVNLSAVPIGRAQHVVVLIAVILSRLSAVPPQLLKWPHKLVMFSKSYYIIPIFLVWPIFVLIIPISQKVCLPFLWTHHTHLALFVAGGAVAVEAEALLAVDVHAGLAVLDVEVGGTLARLARAHLVQVAVSHRVPAQAALGLHLDIENIVIIIMNIVCNLMPCLLTRQLWQQGPPEHSASCLSLQVMGLQQGSEAQPGSEPQSQSSFSSMIPLPHVP